MTPEQIARAFSGHQFEHVYDPLRDDTVWDLVGEAHADPLVLITPPPVDSNFEHPFENRPIVQSSPHSLVQSRLHLDSALSRCSEDCMPTPLNTLHGSS